MPDSATEESCRILHQATCHAIFCETEKETSGKVKRVGNGARLSGESSGGRNVFASQGSCTCFFLCTTTAPTAATAPKIATMSSGIPIVGRYLGESPVKESAGGRDAMELCKSGCTAELGGHVRDPDDSCDEHPAAAADASIQRAQQGADDSRNRWTNERDDVRDHSERRSDELEANNREDKRDGPKDPGDHSVFILQHRKHIVHSFFTWTYTKPGET